MALENLDVGSNAHQNQHQICDGTSWYDKASILAHKHVIHAHQNKLWGCLEHDEDHGVLCVLKVFRSFLNFLSRLISIWQNLCVLELEVARKAPEKVVTAVLLDPAFPAEERLEDVVDQWKKADDDNHNSDILVVKICPQDVHRVRNEHIVNV